MRRVSVQNELQMNNPSVLTSNDWKVIDKYLFIYVYNVKRQQFAGNGALNVAWQLKVQHDTVWHASLKIHRYINLEQSVTEVQLDGFSKFYQQFLLSSLFCTEPHPLREFCLFLVHRVTDESELKSCMCYKVHEMCSLTMNCFI